MSWGQYFRRRRRRDKRRAEWGEQKKRKEVHVCTNRHALFTGYDDV